MIGLALAAALFAPQTIDGESEAWAIANRNGVLPAEWALISYNADAAHFVKKGAGRRRWVAALETSDLTITLMLMDVTCASRQYQIVQANTRNWLGESVSDAGPGDPLYAAPGSAGELVVEEICKAPPPVTLPIEPRR
jgi:hypothetical protein